MSNNKFLSDYVYLAEASYADFTGIEITNGIYNSQGINDAINVKKPENFATLVTDNYNVVAHYTDRAWIGVNDESSFSGTLFEGNQTLVQHN